MNDLDRSTFAKVINNSRNRYSAPERWECRLRQACESIFGLVWPLSLIIWIRVVLSDSLWDMSPTGKFVTCMSAVTFSFELLIPTLTVSCPCPADLLCHCASKSVHSFWKSRVHKFGNGQTNGQTDERTDGRTTGDENIMPPAASLAWWRLYCTERQCVSAPCTNGGTCQEDFANKNFTCTCPKDYGGPVCQYGMFFSDHHYIHYRIKALLPPAQR